jgi:undecaprenyl-diphosphatase
VDYLAAIVLALVQGLTEFLPISSSAHLILVPRFLAWEDQGLAFDVAVHLGTLLAVLWYFRDEVNTIFRAWLLSALRRPYQHQEARLGWLLLLATTPLVIVGFLAEDFVAGRLRSPLLIAAATAVFGVVLWLADLRRHDGDDPLRISLRAAMLIGLAQVLALVPGTSRSGITITAGLALGLSRQTAARFSFLLAIPAVGGASVLELAALLESPTPVSWDAIAIGLSVAAASAYLCISWFLAAIQRVGMLPFMIYRLLLAAVIIVAFG